MMISCNRAGLKLFSRMGEAVLAERDLPFTRFFICSNCCGVTPMRGVCQSGQGRKRRILPQLVSVPSQRSWLLKGIYNIDWIMQAMDVTQWGMLAATVVALGFLALKTRR